MQYCPDPPILTKPFYTTVRGYSTLPSLVQECIRRRLSCVLLADTTSQGDKLGDAELLRPLRHDGVGKQPAMVNIRLMFSVQLSKQRLDGASHHLPTLIEYNLYKALKESFVTS